MSNPVFDYIQSTNAPGSNKAGSYIRALDVINKLVRNGDTPFPQDRDLWEITSLDLLQKLHSFVIDEQHKGENSIFNGKIPNSYWKSGFCSAAVKAVIQYAALQIHKNKFMDILEGDKTGEEISESGQALEIPCPELFLEGKIKLNSKEGKDILRQVRVRQNQNLFREMLLTTYHHKCCLTGLDAPALLRASHISPWAKDKKNRLNPENGLLLSATYDAAFDQHLITFDEDYRMVIGKSLRDYCTGEAYTEYFAKREGQKIILPSCHLPSQRLLEKHRNILA